MGDIARATGLSTMTVSRALRESASVSEATRKKVLAATKRLDYHVDFIARQLRAKHTYQLGVVVPFRGYVGQYYFGQILQGIQEVLTRTDYHISLFDSLSEDFNDPQKCVDLCHQRRVGGLIIVAPGRNERFPKTFVNLEMPLIVVGSSLGRQSISYVDVDNYNGACAMTQHLIGLGHKKIGFIKGLSDRHDAAQRELAFRKTMEAHDVAVVAKWIGQGDYETRKAFHLSLDWLTKRDRPTAVFAANDQMAYGTIDAARALGLRVPEDISVAGFDDIEGSAEFVPALTTVAQPMASLGRVAARYLLDVFNKANPTSVLHHKLPTQLVTRSSTGPPS
jgi:DNA-binding LacI/PurR family transcriptional regulator